MNHTVASMNYHESRRVRLLKRLEQIRAAMMCDDLLVRDLVLGSGQEYSAEKVRQAAERLCDFVDEQQKAFLAFGGVDDGAEQAARQAGGTWPRAARELQTRDDLVSRDLRTLPTTLTADERAAVYAFFYCALHVCLCPAFREESIGNARRIFFATTALLDEGASLPGVDANHGKKLTHEDLIYSEMYALEWSGLGDKILLELGRSDLFCLLDAAYFAIEGKRPTQLDHHNAMEALRQSGKLDRLTEERASVRQLVDEVWRNERLAALAGVEPAEWSAMGEKERCEAALAGIDSCDEAALLEAIDDFAFQQFLSTWQESHDGEWAALGHEGRVEVVRQELQIRLVEAHDEEKSGSDEQRITSWYVGKMEEFANGVREWARQTGCAEELFRQYALLRRRFWDGLPQGAYEGFSRMWGAPNVEGFSQLAQGALEMYLGERGVSRIMDDDLFVQTFDYLDEAKYRLDAALLRDLIS